MSFLHTCILLPGLIATGLAAPVPGYWTAAAGLPSAVVPTTEDGRDESPAGKLLTFAFGDGEAREGAADAGNEGSGTDDEPGSAIPGAFVAVIFGVFGVLVIGRRSRRE